jgi:hypothetical protein
MQIEFLAIQWMPLAQHASLPHRQHVDEIGYKPQRVVRRQNRHANGFAEDHEHEQVLEVSAHARGLSFELEAGRAVEDLAQGACQFGQAREGGREAPLLKWH